MKDLFFSRYPLLLPILVGVASTFGICILLVPILLSRQAAQKISPSQTATAFQYLLLYTEPATNTPEIEVAATQEFKLQENAADDDAITTNIAPSATFVAKEPTASLPVQSCAPAIAELVDALSQEVQFSDPNHEITVGWTVESRAAGDLTFIAARIHNSETQADSTPAVWAIFGYADGFFDLYAVNEIAQEYSFVSWGTDLDPAITMQTNGAQLSYNCA